MMKKVLALALCVCMAAMLLAGCGGAGKHQSDAHLCHLGQRGYGSVR